MSNSIRLFSLYVIAASAILLAGCSKKPAAPPVVVEEEVVEEVEVPALNDDVTDAMAGLSDADRAAAVAQKICPVSDEALGSMGTPLKVTVEGRDVFLCCEGCRDQLQADPAKYLAKLDGNKAP
jgi:hypothetical protein